MPVVQTAVHSPAPRPPAAVLQALLSPARLRAPTPTPCHGSPFATDPRLRQQR